jgi:hypothetical protein
MSNNSSRVSLAKEIAKKLQATCLKKNIAEKVYENSAYWNFRTW